MKVDVRGKMRERAHAEALKLKLKKELPEEFVEECSTLSDLEHRKEIVDALHPKGKRYLERWRPNLYMNREVY